jgi:hypothetical protein
MSAVRLDVYDLEVIEASFRLLETQGDASQAILVAGIREKIESIGVANKVNWGHDLSEYMVDQMDLLERGDLPLADLLADVDDNFKHGRDDNRNEFLDAVKELAKKVVARKTAQKA